jgi:hypothetical protein
LILNSCQARPTLYHDYDIVSAPHILCGDISEPGTLISNPEIPMNLEICHCNPCRRTRGSLGAAFPTLDTLSTPTAYHSSQNITRYFRSTCGSHCFVVNYQNKECYCLGGIIEQSPTSKAINTTWPEDIIKVSRHDFVLGTVDGGLVPLMLNFDGRYIPAASQEQSSFNLPHTTVLFFPANPPAPSHHPKKARISQPSATAEEFPSHPTRQLHIRRQLRRLSQSHIVRSYKVSNFHVCLSLLPAFDWRLARAMALILQANFFNANAQSPSGDQLVPVIFGRATSRPDVNQRLSFKQYWFPPGVYWSFCGKCGATVSYFNSQRLNEVDLAVGILRAEEGSMAKRWLDWEWHGAALRGKY